VCISVPVSISVPVPMPVSVSPVKSFSSKHPGHSKQSVQAMTMPKEIDTQDSGCAQKLMGTRGVMGWLQLVGFLRL